MTVTAILRALAVTHKPDDLARWLATPNPALHGRPIDFLNSQEGREQVADLVLGIDGCDPRHPEFG